MNKGAIGDVSVPMLYFVHNAALRECYKGGHIVSKAEENTRANVKTSYSQMLCLTLITRYLLQSDGVNGFCSRNVLHRCLVHAILNLACLVIHRG